MKQRFWLLACLCFHFTATAQIDTSLLKAIKLNNLPLVKQLVQKGSNIHAVDKNGANTLMWATLNGDLNMVQFFVDQGVSLHPEGVIYTRKNEYFGNLTTIAAGLRGDLNLLKYLIEEQGVPVDDQEFDPKTQKKKGWTSLRWAVHAANRYYLDREEIIDYLLANGASTATVLSHMGNYYFGKGKYFKAKSIYEQRLADLLRRSPKNKATKEGVKTMYGLAGANRVLGNYDQAITLYTELIDLLVATNNKKSQHYIFSLNRIAGVYSHIGDYKKAAAYYERAALSIKDWLGENHREYAINLNSLAKVRESQGQHQAALPLLNQALAVYKTALTKGSLDSIHYYRCLEDIAKNSIYEQTPQALLPQLEQVATYYQKDDRYSYDYSACLAEMGETYSRMGQPTQARLLYEQALQTATGILDKNHQRIRSTTIKLAALEEQMGNTSKSYDYLLAANQSATNEINQLYRQFSEQEQEAMSQRTNHLFNQIQSYNYRHQNLTELCFDNEVLLKGLLLENKKQLLENLSAKQDTSIQATYLKWTQLKRLISKQISKPIEERIADFEQLTQQADELESALARQSSAFRTTQTTLTWQDIAQQLGDKEAFIQFSHFQYHSPVQKTDSTLYVAYLLIKGSTKPQMIPLFEAKELTTILEQTIIQPSSSSQPTAAPVGRGVIITKKKKNLQDVYKILWSPMANLLEGIETVYYTPTGLLHRLNLPTLPIDTSTLLADHYNKMIHLSTPRRLLQALPLKEVSDKTAYIAGGIYYDSIAMPEVLNTPLDTMAIAVTITDYFTYTDPTLRGATWGYLKWTQQESQAITDLLLAQNYQVAHAQGHAATEASFKQLGLHVPSPQVIHLATHGFFFPDPVDNLQRHSQEPIFKISEHPMLRSGLLLAGANRVWSGSVPADQQEDGILTAYEISNMNLTNTELVVLSACETGLGDIKGSEGVYGLQRAFKKAGVRYLIMSLWQVPDKETAIFMTQFYKNWRTLQQDIPTAFATTQKEMRQRFKEPVQWAGFVLVE